MPLHSITPLASGPLLGLWHLTETPAALWPQLAEAAAYAPLLPARADGPRQAQWLAGRVLVQLLLATRGAPLAMLRNDENGRPFLAGPPALPAVSLSHSGEWVVALLAPPGAAVGIDVELVRDKARRIARKFLNEEELAASETITLAGSPEAGPSLELFSLLWSAKETLYKLAGQRGLIFRETLLLDLPAGTWPLPGTLPARLQLNGTSSRHQICYLRPAAGYVLTYCC
ncbi:4'-phosphopantetheinyl transferase superfamily protein [Hymenobacter sp. BRD128]|uniref:4'-phosphopantetheinyl transferase family protein n=1 Tax=Hymenobacter sp. BRD128 TaxID=2675878 RepID=UPI0015659732|nr:4'-phosphopantetheinyl transferase superfamily protein [Hymenobacter sp. BRD128]QKG56167.1 4'-phosphopantetheinyl transferase superfamily protein [Hymenobacter sp. BRD128]